MINFLIDGGVPPRGAGSFHILEKPHLESTIDSHGPRAEK